MREIEDGVLFGWVRVMLALRAYILPSTEIAYTTVAHIKSVCTLICKRTSKNHHLNNFSRNNRPVY